MNTPAGPHRPASLERASDVDHEHPDPLRDEDTRTEFERDRSRILHAEAFRRLQSKTQVFYGVHGAAYRSRLTHSMEVALIAKALARRFGADADLCEAVAIAHDLGHPPFGHNGESVLHELMAPWGGYEGNAQTLRIVRRLERKGHRYDGLNLTWATLDGILKYKVRASDALTSSPTSTVATPLDDETGRPPPGQRTAAVAARTDARDLRPARSAPKCVYDDDWDLVTRITAARGTREHESFECRILNLADDIAYCVADLQDGLMMGFLSMHVLREAALGAGCFDEVFAHAVQNGIDGDEAYVQHLIGEFVALFDEIDSKASAREVRHARKEGLSVATSKELASKMHRHFVRQAMLDDDGAPALPAYAEARIRVLKSVTRTQILKDPRLTTLDAASRRLLRRLFEALANDWELLPRDLQDHLRYDGLDTAGQQRVVCDYVASLTDDGATRAYRRLFEPGSQGLLDFL